MQSLWPHRVLDVAPDALLEEVRAQHAKLSAALKGRDSDGSRRQRLDEALGWLEHHCIDGAASAAFAPRSLVAATAPSMVRSRGAFGVASAVVEDAVLVVDDGHGDGVVVAAGGNVSPSAQSRYKNALVGLHPSRLPSTLTIC